MSMIEELIPLSTKEKALEKMLKEMNKSHSANEDAVHNWLCDQNDDQLFEGVLDNSKSIKGSLIFCKDKAKKKAKDGVAMIDDSTVFSWVHEYFAGKKVSDEMPVEKKETTSKVEKDDELEQLALFGEL